MGRIIFSIVSLVALAVLILMNAGTMSAFNLFGWQFEDVPIIVIAIVSFVLGNVYSFIFYLAGYLARSRKEKLAMQKQRLKSQEQTIKSKDATLKEREKRVAKIAADAEQPRQIPHAADGAEPSGARPVGRGTHVSGASPGAGRAAAPMKRRGWLRNLFSHKTSSGK